MGVPAQQNTEIIEPSNNPLKLDAINEKNGHGCLVFPDVVQENVLNVLRFFRSHGSSPTPFLEPSQPVQAKALGRDGRVAAIQMGARRRITSPAQSETKTHHRGRRGGARNGETPPRALRCRVKQECNRCCTRTPCLCWCRQPAKLPRRARRRSAGERARPARGWACPAPRRLPRRRCRTARTSRAARPRGGAERRSCC